MNFRNIPPVTKNLLIINVLIYVVMSLAPASRQAMMEHYGALHYFSSPLFNPAQLFAYMFMHGGFTHLFFNMFALFMFGPMIEYAMGSKRFVFYYLSCGIGAALIQEGVYAIMISHYHSIFDAETFRYIADKGADLINQNMTFADPTAAKLNMLVNGPTVGASGAIYGVLLAFGMLFPNRTIYLMIPPMPIKAKYLVIGYGVLELALGLSGARDGVAHFCHLGGMAAGLGMILYWKKKGDIGTYY